MSRSAPITRYIFTSSRHSPLHPSPTGLHILWKDFLAEHAKFPFPKHYEYQNASSTLPSILEVSQVDPKWKAKYAICDNALAQKLCGTLDSILGDAVLSKGAQENLLKRFGSAKSDIDEWVFNETEAQVCSKGMKIE